MLTDDYRVQLESFEGPLDLLLYLIRRDEVDIEDIPVASITDQYLRFLEAIDRIDIEVAGEFLVTAASLMEIKSRMLRPDLPVSPEAQAAADAADVAKSALTEDPRAELVRQLLAYKKFRDAADALEHRAEEWGKRFPAAKNSIDDDLLREAIEQTAEDVEIEDLDLLDLVDAFKKISETVNFDRLGEHQVKYDDTPVELHAEDILDHLKRGLDGPLDGQLSAPVSNGDGTRREMELISIFRGRSRGEMVGLFLALLHLVRKRQVAVRQERANGSIFLALREPEPDVGTTDLSTKTD